MSGSKILKAGYWNIHGARNKLEADTVFKWCLNHDVIFLSEIKTNIEFNVPGFTTIIGKTKKPNRGGIALLVKHYLQDKIVKVDKSIDDQIWIQLSLLPNIWLGGCYITPCDSLYYDEQSFAHIQSQCLHNSPDSQYIVLGDMNARVGATVNNLVQGCSDFEYVPSDPDPVTNSNGRKLIQVCKDCDMLVVDDIYYKYSAAWGGI